MKTTKEIITRESIGQELRALNRKSVRIELMLLIPALLIFSPLVLFLTAEILSSVESLLLRVLFGAAFGALAVFPVSVLIYMLCTTCANARLLARGEFDVATYEVSYKSEEYINRRYVVERVYFVGLKKPLEVGHTTYQLTSAGDVFYLVTYRSKKPSVKLMYAAKRYEYVER